MESDFKSIVEPKTYAETRVRYASTSLGVTAVGLGIAAFLKKSDYYPLLSVAAWLLCAVGMGCATWSLVHARQRKQPLLSHVTTLAGLIFVLLALTALNLAVYLAIRSMLQDWVSGENMKGLSCGLYAYCEKHGQYPATLEQIIETGAVSDNALLAPADPHAPKCSFQEGRLVYSSYVYVPGQGPRIYDENIILVYERETFDQGTLSMFTSPLRMVMYDDGYIQALTEDRFVAALRTDRQRRRELGWMTTQSTPGE